MREIEGSAVMQNWMPVGWRSALRAELKAPVCPWSDEEEEEAMAEPVIDLELVRHARTGETWVLGVIAGWSGTGRGDVVAISRRPWHQTVMDGRDWWQDVDFDNDSAGPDVAWAQVQPWITVAVHLEAV